MSAADGLHPVTPVMSTHARERCAEMGIPTKLAKAIWIRQQGGHGGTSYPDPSRGTGRLIVRADEFPGYAIVVDPHSDRPVIVTVLFDSQEQYVREGRTYRVVEGDDGSEPGSSGSPRSGRVR